MKNFQRRGALSLGEVPNAVITFVLIVAVLVAGYLVLAGLGNASNDARVATAVGNGTSALDNITTQTPTWATVLAVSVILGLVIFGFAFSRGRGMF